MPENQVKKIAVIVAGGSGSRMHAAMPKQFLLLNGKPVLTHTLEVFLKSYPDMQVVLVLPAQYIKTASRLTDALAGKERIRFTEGGATRFESVKNGLQLVHQPSIVFVHDAVRCLLSEDLIHRCFEQAMDKGSAIPAVAATDSIRIIKNGHHQIENRQNVRIIQTPQTFRSNILLPAYAQPYRESFTDEASVVESSGEKVYLIEGEYANIKLTRPMDLILAEQLLKK